MNRARRTITTVAVVVLLTACGGGSSTTTTSTAPSTSSSTPTSPSASPDGSSPAPGASPTGALTTQLVALQLCGTTLGYAAGAISGLSADQLAKLATGVESSQSKAGASEAALLAQSRLVVTAVTGGDVQTIALAGKKMGELCGAG